MKTLDLAPRAPETAESPAANELPVKAANEDSPAAGALYRLIARRPSRRIPAAAAVASLFCVGAAAAYLWGFYGAEGLSKLTPNELVLIGLGAALPIILVWFAAYAIWRGQEMKLMAEALARTAIRMTDPADPASEEIITISQAVRRELDAMKEGLAQALAETVRLNALVAEELDAIDKGTGRAEERTRVMGELLSEQREGLGELARAIGSESDTVARSIREQVDAVRGLVDKAATTLDDAGTRIVAQTETLARVSEAARAGADATTSMLDRQASRLEVVANAALSQADTLAQRYETKRQLIGEAAERLSTEREKLEAVFEEHRDNMLAADQAMNERTQEIGHAAAELAARLNATFDNAAERAKALDETISADILRAVAEMSEASGTISRSAGAATRAIGATVDELRGATGALGEDVTRAAADAIGATVTQIRAATSMMANDVTKAAATLSTDIAERTNALRVIVTKAVSDSDHAGERFNAAMIRLGGAAKEAGRAMQEASSELEARLSRMPVEAAASAASLNHVLQDQLSALASIADIVTRHARTLDRTSPGYAAPAHAGETPPPPPRPDMAWPDASRPADTSRNWGISDLLAAAERLPDRDAPPKPGELTDGMSDSEFHRSSLQVIETLQALAVDLDRALEQSPPAELWQRYQAGERNVFARRLYNIAGRQLYDRIAVKYRGDEEFRDHVDRFVSLFERLLASASTRDRENILAETYLTSDTGKAYLILAQASGKLA
ncbi:hypothetical protein F2P47_14610 [Parvibaculum sedimenti]|uniref:Uncharacterized protein n=1 Tax=Parvibaculum sedimenti TaxID=2608632 RepID=A0A6N6VFL1_9HYPH|nr:hypothetical protein [Parvibaculum sedimenti]KAB7739026.1 hypothetical protein F2P47_14610 [Parvibaculum sedimenti]